MLTMSQAFATDGSSDHMGVSLDNSGAPPAPSVAQRQRKGRRRLNASFSDDYGDAVSKVHQDDEYSKFSFLEEWILKKILSINS